MKEGIQEGRIISILTTDGWKYSKDGEFDYISINEKTLIRQFITDGSKIKMIVRYPEHAVFEIKYSVLSDYPQI